MPGSGGEGRVEGLCIKESGGGVPISGQGVLCIVGRVCRRAGMAGADRLEATKEMASLRIKQYGRQAGMGWP